jgi:ATP-binding cassette, subfamily F, member 3
MSLIKAHDLCKSYGAHTVIVDATFTIEKGDKIALIGLNGVGKTTLLNVLAGLEEYDGGTLEVSKGVRIGYIRQDMGFADDGSIREYIESRTGLNADAHRVQTMLAGFGLDAIDFARPVSFLSGGQKSKMALAVALLGDADVLFLDEPTNNLDLPALIWLEQFIKASELACVIVSHDRRFLDAVATKLLELSWDTHEVVATGGSYSQYLATKERELARQRLEYRLQQEEIDRLTERVREKKADAIAGSKWKGSDNDGFLRGFKRDQAAHSAKTAKALEKRIERIEKIDRPHERNPFEIPLAAKVRPGVLDLKLTEVYAGYEGGNDSFKIGPLSIEVAYGNRIGIMGLNGSGKSTLLKTITGELAPLSGSVSRGSGLRIGNLMQAHETLPRAVDPISFLVEQGKVSVHEAHAWLGKFDLTKRQMDAPIQSLNPGARTRLLLALFAIESVNMLVLDEPTNHLDLEALSALEEVLGSYSGSVVLVSHDRYFLEKTRIDDAYVLDQGTLLKVPDYKAYEQDAEKKARKLLRSIEG